MVGSPLFDFGRRPTRPPPGRSTSFPGYVGTTTGFPPTVRSSKRSSAAFCPPGTSRIDALLPFAPMGFPLGISRSFGDGGVDDDMAGSQEGGLPRRGGRPPTFKGYRRPVRASSDLSRTPAGPVSVGVL